MKPAAATFTEAEAEERFFELLDRVAQGEEIAIERASGSVVVMVPINKPVESDVR